ncbi:related to cholinesterase [Cephalotrichum gorgonifer]|uniref:Related to cholinesterase n=1 Tax=Cephalotrichum gorgonifer TaxID=2041049 RepID=A0AAE8SWF5_9PEZI|nr:related to cholinesterase [Cephalotrichum gorgonifer]
MVPAWITALLAGSALGAPPSPAGLKSDITILVDNDLQGPASPTADSAIILLGSKMTLRDAEAACAALGEQLWAPELGASSIRPNLDFLRYQNKSRAGLWIAPANGTARSISTSGDISGGHEETARLPALCTQTAPFSSGTIRDTSEQWRISIRANDEELVGYRDRNSFRFMSVRYAPEPERFGYAKLHEGKGDEVSALEYGSQCFQGTSGSEDCLFLNIWTPHLPRPRCTGEKGLKPVMLWIHGGGFTGGTANDAVFDGGNLASRGDVVLVAANYRLGKFGFLALDDGETNGNYGLADAILALDWVRAHVRALGGDPDRITVFGQSAGAAVVRAMLASPAARGKFAAAVPLSNLGGMGYGAPYSKYLSVPEAAASGGAALLEAANCTDVSCLRKVPAEVLSGLAGDVRFLVVDGEYLVADGLQFSGDPLDVRLMIGITAEDGTPMTTYTRDVSPEDTEWLTSQGLPYPPRSVFPLPDVENSTLAVDTMAARLTTDAMFRCTAQATANALLSASLVPEIYYYEFDRTYQTPGWPKLDLCEPGGDPAGDPSTSYYLQCHSGELLYVFGNVAREGLPTRDVADLAFGQFVLDTFASFARTFDPNPEVRFLTARGYTGTVSALEKMGRWEAATGGNLKLRALGWAGEGMEGFRDVEQCEWLGLGLEYYL